MAQSNEELIRFRNLTRRTLLLGGAQLALFGALGFRLHQLQVTESERFRVLSDDNRINLRLLSPKRGRILDRFGVPLAINDQNYRVVLIAEQTEGVDETLRRLGQLLPIDDSVKQRVVKEVGRNRAFVPILVMENLTWDQVSAVEINAPDLPGVSIEVGETRTYPFGDPFAHSIGYVASVSEKELQEQNDPLLSLPEFRIGKSGAEKVYDLALRGKAGNSQVEVNAYGRVIRELERDEGTPGRELVLTLDSGLQNYVHQRLMGEIAASSVVLDIVTGDVLAMASVPSYNPNSFTLGLSSQEWQALVDDPLKPLSNRTVNGLYAPGSTFKMVVALAALEAGVSPAQQVFCPGHYELGNARFHCWKKGGHGHVDLELGIKHSCDVYFYDTARRVGIDRISEVAFHLGLGAESGIDLPSEKGGVIPTRAWKEQNLGEAWQGGETLVTAIGQGFVLATPLQLSVMVARLASGLAVTPHLARGFRDQGPDDPAPPATFPSLGFSEEHLAIVRQAMNRVVNEQGGTAFGSRIEDIGWEMAGKTGTSQVRRISMAERAQGVTRNEDLPWHRRDHALFVAFAPVLQPRYACAVVVDHGSGGSKAAAPIARDVLTEVQRRNSAGQPALPQLAATET